MFLRVIVVLLVGLGLTGFVGAYLLAQQQTQPAAPPVVSAPPPARIMVSARPIRAGNLIVPEDLEVAAVDLDKVQPGALRDTPESRAKLRGAMVRHSLAAGEAFMPGDFLSPGDRGFLAAVLEPGMRAITISVDAVSGTAGLIWPGDRVDVLLTQNIDDQTLPPSRRVAGSTLLENTRVIAVDQQLVQGAQTAANGQPNVSNRTVTLEVSPVDAERTEVAARLGRLSLSVHPATQAIAGAGQPAVNAEPPQPVFGGDVSPSLPTHDARKVVVATVRVFQGGGGEPAEYKFAADDRPANLEAVVSQSGPAIHDARRPSHGANRKAAQRRPADAPAAGHAIGPVASAGIVRLVADGSLPTPRRVGLAEIGSK